MEEVIISQEDGMIALKNGREPSPRHKASIQQAGIPVK